MRQILTRRFRLYAYRHIINTGEGKESIRWPDSLRQSMTSVLYPEQCIHVGDRESHCHEQFCLSPESHFCYKFILTNLLSMRNILFQ
ncbi:hypothetical protein C9218_20315 [Escherichia coli]|nr:hypothetical protein [Escherichia coli]EFB5434412.1 hypothetical protein [Escherichia coli O157]EAA2356236.1 hypothetical protein [Escherichia coli]EEX0323432.1 hypothetical protein [Escherichia coli]EFH9774039.1 hypothetical protein [Escherichia coli]